MEMHRTYCHGAEKSFKSPNFQDLTKFDETIIPFALVEYEIVIYHLISDTCSWINC